MSGECSSDAMFRELLDLSSDYFRRNPADLVPLVQIFLLDIYHGNNSKIADAIRNFLGGGEDKQKQRAKKTISVVEIIKLFLM